MTVGIAHGTRTFVIMLMKTMFMIVKLMCRMVAGLHGHKNGMWCCGRRLRSAWRMPGISASLKRSRVILNGKLHATSVLD